MKHKKQKQREFWKHNINPITGWVVVPEKEMSPDIITQNRLRLNQTDEIQEMIKNTRNK